jgi:hypothetical protein
MDEIKDIELSDGGCIEYPDPSGNMRRRDIHGNLEEVRGIDDEGWAEWARLFDVTKEDFDDDEDEDA